MLLWQDVQELAEHVSALSSRTTAEEVHVSAVQDGATRV